MELLGSSKLPTFAKSLEEATRLEYCIRVPFQLNTECCTLLENPAVLNSQ